jgi:hypothetical protein
MRWQNASVSMIEDEKRLLRFLCSNAEDLSVRKELLQRLNKYSWRERDHQILFEAVSELLLAAPHQVLEHLPATLTRRGFPDISYSWLAGSPALDAAAVFALAEELLHASQ